MELEAAKSDGYLPGLSHLNTSRGVSPIVQKLPHALQEKWITVGSRCKEYHILHSPSLSTSSVNKQKLATTPDLPALRQRGVLPKQRKTTRTTNTDVLLLLRTERPSRFLEISVV